jgi:hypothetical protein
MPEMPRLRELAALLRPPVVEGAMVSSTFVEHLEALDPSAQLDQLYEWVDNRTITRETFKRLISQVIKG